MAQLERDAALFLDRDGIINVDHGHVGTIDRWEFLPGIFDLCRAAMARGFRLIVVTNQAGIARGYYSEDDFHALTGWMKMQFRAQNVAIDGVYFCPYHATEGQGRYMRASDDRKPAPGMLLRAAKDFTLDLPCSVMIGDSETDMQAGRAAGVGRLILVKDAGISAETTADIVVGSVTAAIEYLPGNQRSL